MHPTQIILTLSALFGFCSLMVLSSAWLFPYQDALLSFFTSAGSAFIGAITTYLQVRRKDGSDERE